jgi:glycosyltransferase involved in cell wall biosynthesis
VVAYLECLAEHAEITLVSFEKDDRFRNRMRDRLADSGVDWHPLEYHATPKVASTAWDVRQGVRLLNELATGTGPDIVHTRSYVAALMAVRSRALQNARFLFDIRGFWADERLEAGIWRRGLLYGLAKRFEREFFARADAVVTLTDASVTQVRRWVGDRDIPVVVIPTCVDLERFRPNPPRGRSSAIWNGSVGTWYRFDLAVPFARALEMPLKVLTRQVDLARAVLDGREADVRSVEPESVPGELRRGDVGLCLYQPSFSRLATAPTRFGEHLAAGNPVVTLPGVGDMAEIVRRERVGVVLDDESSPAMKRAASELKALLREPGTTDRCVDTAKRLFPLDLGVRRYSELYERLVERDQP